MGQESKIQWTDATWNPWHGCVKVSPGCKFCYMYRDKERYGQDPTNVMRSKGKFKEPLSWKEPRLIFTCSWSDFFIEHADKWRKEAWAIIKATPHHTYQILTKRPERIEDCLPEDWGNGYPNVWLGVSIEDDSTKHRLRTLDELKTDSSVFKIFVSYEPALGYLDLDGDDMITSVCFERLDWLIIGGESGNETGKYKYRPAEIEWFYQIIEQCRQRQVSVFVKQLGTHLAKKMGLKDRAGGDMSEWPLDLQIREMPKNDVAAKTPID